MPTSRFRSPLQGALLDAWLNAAGDPEKSIGTWVCEGVPLGIERSIPSRGIFPGIDDEQCPLEAPCLGDAYHDGSTNCSSFTEQSEDALAELQRYLDHGFGGMLEIDAAATRPDGSISKRALIVKIRICADAAPTAGPVATRGSCSLARRR